jgi:hypothetical protein
VARTDAGPGESCTMTTPNASTSMGRGRGTLPLHSIPKTKPGRLHKNLDTPRKRLRLSRTKALSFFVLGLPLLSTH